MGANRRFSGCYLVLSITLVIAGCAGLPENPEDISPLLAIPDFTPFVQANSSSPNAQDQILLTPRSPTPPKNQEKTAPEKPAAFSKGSEATPVKKVILSAEAPARALRGQELFITLRANNRGPDLARNLAIDLDLPPGVRYLKSDPTANRSRETVTWNLGDLPPGQATAVRLRLQAVKESAFSFKARLHDATASLDESSFKVNSDSPQLQVRVEAPDKSGLGEPVTYQISIRNIGSGAIAQPRMEAVFDAGLEHESRANPLAIIIDDLPAGQTKLIPLVLTPRTPGRHQLQVTVSVQDNLSARTEHDLTVGESQFQVIIHGPSRRYVGRAAVWQIEAVNGNQTSIDIASIEITLPPELSCMEPPAYSKIDLRPDGVTIVRWQPGPLAGQERRTVEFKTRCDKIAFKSEVLAAATTGEGRVLAQAKASLEITGKPSLHLSVRDVQDPVGVGAVAVYEITISNTGALAASGIDLSAEAASLIRLESARGPTSGTINGSHVSFRPLDVLPPGQSVVYTIEARAQAAGESVLHVELMGAGLKEPLTALETTTFQPSATGNANSLGRGAESEATLTPPRTEERVDSPRSGFRPERLRDRVLKGT